MNSIIKSITILGFGINMILIVLFTIGNGNYVYAVEYTNYTSEKYGINLNILLIGN